jgi:Right handed beta helix region
MRKLLLVLGLIWGMALPAAATDRYAAPTGSGSACTNIATPCTIQTCVDQTAAGDTCYLRGGTYTLSAFISIGTSGTSGNLKRLFNFSGETPVIDGINITTSFHSNIQMNNASWWHIKGLEIINAAAHGLYISGASNNNTIECNNFHHNVRLQGNGGGLMLEGTGNGNLYLNNDSHHNSYGGSVGSGGDGIGLTYTQTGTNTIRGNRAWRNNDDGIDIWCSNGTLVEGNWSWENGYDDNLLPTNANGVGFKVGGNSDSNCGNSTSRYNIAWHNKESGFDENAGTVPSRLYNNTSWDHQTAGNTNFAFFVTPTASILRNNLAFLPNTMSFNAAIIHDHNSFDLAVTVNAADFVTTDFTPNVGPRKADCSLPDSNFLHLAPGSDLIDKGVDVGLPFTGAAPDLGAYEFAVTGTAPTNLRVLR